MGLQNSYDSSVEESLVEDDSFSFHRIKKGELLLLGDQEYNSIVFVLEGTVEFLTSNKNRVVLEAGFMYNFSMYKSPYSGTAIVDTQFIRLKSTTLIMHISAIRHQQIMQSESSGYEEVAKLQLGNVLRSYLDGIIALIQSNILDANIYEVKKIEFLLYMQKFYPDTELSYFFHETNSRYPNFRVTVYSKYSNSATVKTLADSCYMTTRTFTRRFKTEFGMLPHKWLIQQKIRNLNELIFKGTDINYILETFDFSSITELKQFCVRYKLENIIVALKFLKNAM